ncbi:MAG: tRNA preQ1(34) S-adenosylmethionine ribosyltransferase-isomerase QueA [Candidatus Woesearchaeota archaeon]
MNLNDYSYVLPEELIAQKPTVPKDKCRLLIVNKNKLEHKLFKNILDYLKKGDVLVLNNTKVTKSKILGNKETGSKAEIILLRKIQEDTFEAKIKTKNPIIGNKILVKKGFIEIIAQKNIDTFIVKLSTNKILSETVLPTPPYIHRIVKDNEYQTIFSKEEGSLAAPTAGLHFTKKLIKDIEKKGVKIAYITLHVSYGTFKNIDNIKNYIMDPEYYEISKNTADIINNRLGKLIVCGTTTLKALETASKKGKITPQKNWSKLFIYPPYKFKSKTDILITNFHLPKSTLLLLTCAFGGQKRILKAYNEAVKNNYKFYSLGDAMIIYKK